MSATKIFTVAGVGLSAIFDANDFYTNITWVVTPAGAANWSVNITGSVDGINFYNIGFPTAAAGGLGTVIGAITQATFNWGYNSAGAWRYFRLNTTALDAGSLTVGVACK